VNDALRVRPTREGTVSTTEPVTGAGLLDWLAGLVEAHAERTIGPDAADARLLRVSLSRPMHHRGDRHHRVLTAYYRAGGAVRERRIWLKFLHDGRTSDLKVAIREHMSEGSEANGVIRRFNNLREGEKQDLLNFLRSL